MLRVVRAGRGGGGERRAVHGDGWPLYGRGVARHEPAAVHVAVTRTIAAAPIVAAADELLEQKLL